MACHPIVHYKNNLRFLQAIFEMNKNFHLIANEIPSVSILATGV
jgi:hypothetical protein